MLVDKNSAHRPIRARSTSVRNGKCATGASGSAWAKTIFARASWKWAHVPRTLKAASGSRPRSRSGTPEKTEPRPALSMRPRPAHAIRIRHEMESDAVHQPHDIRVEVGVCPNDRGVAIGELA